MSWGISFLNSEPCYVLFFLKDHPGATVRFLMHGTYLQDAQGMALKRFKVIPDKWCFYLYLRVCASV